MKISIRVISMILALVLTIPMTLVSCTDKEEKPESVPKVTIFENGNSEFTIIRPEESSSVILKSAIDLSQAFEKNLGKAMTIKSDFLRKGEEPPKDTKEILIGNTNRPESAKAMEEMTDGGFLIKVYGERIAIVGADDVMLREAVNHFISEYVTKANEKVEIAGDYIFVGNASEYSPIKDNNDGTVTIKLNNFVVVYDKDCQQTFVPAVAKAFVKRMEAYGIPGHTEDTSVNDYEILFGACDREDYKTTEKSFMFRDFYIGYSNNKLSVSAFSIYGYENAINYLESGFSAQGITIPKDGVYVEHDYKDMVYADVFRNYENPCAEGAWMVNVSHRGDFVTNKNPENSIPAYQSCIDNKVDVIETDLHLTKDGVWVICHDSTIDRTTTGKGNISEMTFEQTQKYFLKTKNGGSGASVTDQRMPTLTDIIELCRGKCLFNLDKLDPTKFQSVYDVFEKEGAVDMAMFKSSAWTAEQLTAWFCELLQDGRKLPLYAPLLYSNTLNKAATFKGLTSMTETGRDHDSQTLNTILNDYNIRAMCLTALDSSRENVEYYTKLKNVGYTAIMTDEAIKLKVFIHG